MGKGLKVSINSKLFIIILILTLLCTTLLVGTYAWFTWSSTDNTSLTMTIGQVADVVFSKGNEIDGGLAPVFNYTDGLSTSFTVNNRDTSGAVIEYNIKFNIASIASELINENVKYDLVKNGNVVSSGDLSDVTAGSSITVLTSNLDSGVSSYIFYLYIDGNVENDLDMMDKTIVGSITLDANELNVSPLSDFVYVLGSETPVLDTLTLDGTKIVFPSIQLDSNEILLADYIGTSVNVSIPDTYIVNGTTYNVTVLSYLYVGFSFINYNYEYYYGGVFSGNDYIESVLLGNNIKFIYTYYDEEGIGFGYDAFSITENSAERLFYNCTSLIVVPEIPSSVTDMSYTFYGCTSLVNAPKIPNSVTSMRYTFYGCTNLTGTVRINSRNISSSNNIAGIFTNTSKPITVEVPVGSTTYNTINALTTSNGKPSNVTLVTY